jgi:hypothetical protein
MRADRDRTLSALLASSLFIGVAVLAAALTVQTENVQALKKEADSPPPTVVKTVKVTMPPKTVEVTVRVTQRASRSQPRREVAGSTNATLACIRKHESTNRYTAVSASGTYRGAYQMSRVYSPAWAERAGYKEWSGKPADKWPPAVQDAVAAHMGRSGWGHWSKHTSYSCPGF